MYSHIVPSLNSVENHNAMEPSYQLRPTTTRQTHLQPTIQIKQPVIQRTKYTHYDQSRTTALGSNGAPFSGYTSNVDTETVLRNQVVPLRRGDETVYIPSTESDLYHTYQATTSNRPPMVDTRQLSALFNEQTFDEHNPNVLNVGTDVFSNHTRTQRN